MRHFKDYFKSSALNDSDFAWDQDTVIKINSIQEETLQTRDGDKIYLCATLEGLDKPFRMNATICKSCKKAFKTPDLDSWVGKYISVYVQRDLKAFGELHDVLRVRPVAPKPPIVSPPADKTQLEAIRKGFKAINQDEQDYLKKAKLNNLEELNSTKAEQILKWLASKEVNK